MLMGTSGRHDDPETQVNALSTVNMIWFSDGDQIPSAAQF
jgi:hypothetical protein